MEADELTRIYKPPPYMRKNIKEPNDTPSVLHVGGGVGSGDSVEIYLPNNYIWIDLGLATYYIGDYAREWKKEKE